MAGFGNAPPLLPVLNLTEVAAMKPFVAIGARECTDPREAERGILQEFLDPQAKRFLECFVNALPKLSPAEIAWGYQAMLGVTILYVADGTRITRISGGAARAGDAKSATAPLVNFCTGGWLALWEAGKRRGRKKPSAARATSGRRTTGKRTDSRNRR